MNERRRGERRRPGLVPEPIERRGERRRAAQHAAAAPPPDASAHPVGPLPREHARGPQGASRSPAPVNHEDRGLRQAIANAKKTADKVKALAKELLSGA